MNMKRYIVKKGDTLSGIAKKYNTSPDVIKKYNSLIKDVNKISAGWVLNIPVSEGSEKVSEGCETLKTLINNCMDDIEKLESYKKLCDVMGW